MLWIGIALVIPLVIATAITVMAGPFLWGHAIGEFHLSHHIVRAILLAAAIVLYFCYVALHR